MLQERPIAPFALLLACILPAACASGPTGPIAGPAKGGVVQAAAPGQVECRASSPAVTAAGLTANNRARRQAGLPPVAANALLASAAAAHACDMARSGRMAYAGSRSSGPAQRIKAAGYAPRITAENIAAGPYDVEQTLRAWSGSGGHRANMLIPQVREFGMGEATAADGRTRFWSAIYAAPGG
ncbi:CAP domain-containing protein [Paracoccus aminovorans]|uniref:CAP domain-containing protein n=1 Tax=Paracoccus aminovorans TaxID=34004 RepID=UPI002B263F26|nr:CAP domain-containing protein [Paracoccus aminovorans]